MKLIALAAASLVAFATPALAQTTPDGTPMPTTDEAQTTDDPRGGYAPATPLFSSPPQPGQPVRFVPNTLTPTQAFPPPAPLPSYPICKRGQYDKCRQRGG
jgi:hypothetical protein